jgi:hypothetical protein
MIKQGTSEYERIQASVSLQAAACCGSEETELRDMHRKEADLHMARYRSLREVEAIVDQALVVADELAHLGVGGDLDMVKALLKLAYTRGVYDARSKS